MRRGRSGSPRERRGGVKGLKTRRKVRDTPQGQRPEVVPRTPAVNVVPPARPPPNAQAINAQNGPQNFQHTYSEKGKEKGQQFFGKVSGKGIQCWKCGGWKHGRWHCPSQWGKGYVKGGQANFGARKKAKERGLGRIPHQPQLHPPRTPYSRIVAARTPTPQQLGPRHPSRAAMAFKKDDFIIRL